MTSAPPLNSAQNSLSNRTRSTACYIVDQLSAQACGLKLERLQDLPHLQNCPLVVSEAYVHHNKTNRRHVEYIRCMYVATPSDLALERRTHHQSLYRWGVRRFAAQRQFHTPTAAAKLYTVLFRTCQPHQAEDLDTVTGSSIGAGIKSRVVLLSILINCEAAHGRR
jgi:hypothetical protein